FNILGLPTELISHVFSFLSMEDRLRARVNKRLDAIELASKYYVECVLIEEMSLSKFASPSDRNCVGGGVNRDYFQFNILGLPTELISHSFSFMSMEDRLRARVNKRLNDIELKSKYHVERV
ncbi:hypothetical protein PENTCL1PPCAC_19553, partial [Pristionchus entomophagus]